MLQTLIILALMMLCSLPLAAMLATVAAPTISQAPVSYISAPRMTVVGWESVATVLYGSAERAMVAREQALESWYSEMYYTANIGPIDESPLCPICDTMGEMRDGSKCICVGGPLESEGYPEGITSDDVDNLVSLMVAESAMASWVRNTLPL